MFSDRFLDDPARNSARADGRSITPAATDLALRRMHLAARPTVFRVHGSDQHFNPASAPHPGTNVFAPVRLALAENHHHRWCFAFISLLMAGARNRAELYSHQRNLSSAIRMHNAAPYLTWWHGFPRTINFKAPPNVLQQRTLGTSIISARRSIRQAFRSGMDAKHELQPAYAGCYHSFFILGIRQLAPRSGAADRRRDASGRILPGLLSRANYGILPTTRSRCDD